MLNIFPCLKKRWTKRPAAAVVIALEHPGRRPGHELSFIWAFIIDDVLMHWPKI